MPDTPIISGKLRSHMIEVPEVILQCSGIKIFGKKIRSLAFTTDVAIVRNINANAIIAVYPFTPQPSITHSIMMAAEMPVFCGVGGGITGGRRVVSLASDAEFQGAIGVVVNAPTPNGTIKALANEIDIPIVVTAVSEYTDIEERLKAGAEIFNVSGAADTPKIVKKIREVHPDVPIIATGGNDDDNILRTIEAGANAITYTPPSCGTLFRELMEKYRDECDGASAPLINRREELDYPEE